MQERWLLLLLRPYDFDPGGVEVCAQTVLAKLHLQQETLALEKSEFEHDEINVLNLNMRSR